MLFIRFLECGGSALPVMDDKQSQPFYPVPQKLQKLLSAKCFNIFGKNAFKREIWFLNQISETMNYLCSQIETLNLIFLWKEIWFFRNSQLWSIKPKFHLPQPNPSQVKVGVGMALFRWRANQNKLQSLPNFGLQTLECIQ